MLRIKENRYKGASIFVDAGRSRFVEYDVSHCGTIVASSGRNKSGAGQIAIRFSIGDQGKRLDVRDRFVVG